MKPPSESEKTNPNEPNFKIGKMNLNSVKSMDYINKRDWALGENKPKQTQFKPNFKGKKPPIAFNKSSQNGVELAV